MGSRPSDRWSEYAGHGPNAIRPSGLIVVTPVTRSKLSEINSWVHSQFRRCRLRRREHASVRLGYEPPPVGSQFSRNW